MRLIVIGSGLIGVTTAYALKQRGHEITVIDRQSGPGRETSFANGALLTPSMSNPWNAPETWRVLLASLGRIDSPLQLRPRALPSLLRWGVKFLRNSRSAAYERSTLSNLRLGLYSLEALRALREQTGIEYGRSAVGALKMFRNAAALQLAAAEASRWSGDGLCCRELSMRETIELEPALAPISGQLAGAIHFAADEIGDAYRYCLALTQKAQEQGVQFRFNTEVSSLEARSGRVTAVMTPGGRFFADGYVVAAGSFSVPMLRQVGVLLPVQPAKGYSVTVDCGREANSLNIPIIDDDLHAAIVPLDGAIRVAGTAEFAGYDLTPNPRRIGNLTALLQRVLPKAPLAINTARPWCGLRAMSADGVPIIGSTPLANLFVNTGHGHLGWTMAAGSARLLTDVIEGQPSAIETAPYQLERFTSES
jgi:D-amino-acid dehydrogenase